MSVEKTNTKVTTSINKKRSKQRDEEIRIPSTTWDVFKAREKSRVQGAIGFVFASHWLKNWREILKPITKRSNINHVISFDSQFKTAQFAY